GRLAALLVIAAVVGNSVDAFKLMRSDDDRSPYRAFRDRGFAAVIQRLNAQLAPSEVIVAPQDVGYYFHGRYYALDVARDHEGVEAIVPLIRREGIRYGVDLAANPSVIDIEARFRQAGLSESERVGDFVVYARRSDAR